MQKSLNIFAIVIDSVMYFPLLRKDEEILLFLLFIDVIDLIPLMPFFFVFNIFLEICREDVYLFRVLKKN